MATKYKIDVQEEEQTEALVSAKIRRLDSRINHFKKAVNEMIDEQNELKKKLKELKSNNA